MPEFVNVSRLGVPVIKLRAYSHPVPVRWLLFVAHERRLFLYLPISLCKQLKPASTSGADSRGSRSQITARCDESAETTTLPQNGQSTRWNAARSAWQPVTFVGQEILARVIDVRTPHSRSPMHQHLQTAWCLVLFRNSLAQMGGQDYALTGNMITFVPAATPQTGESTSHHAQRAIWMEAAFALPASATVLLLSACCPSKTRR